MKLNRILLLMVSNRNTMAQQEELGLCSITAYIRKHGYEVKLMSADIMRVDYKAIWDWKPDFIGMTIYDITRDDVLSAAFNIKEMMGSVKICLGGSGADSITKEMMQQHDYIDYIVRGEGEQATLELLEGINGGGSLFDIKGLLYRRHGEVTENAKRKETICNLDSMPWCARDILIERKLKIASMYASRGCTSNCSFCHSKSVWSGWNIRDIYDVVDEIEYLNREYGIDMFNFIDVSFELPKKNNYERIRIFAEEIIRRKLQVSYFVDIKATFSRDAPESIFQLLKESGLCGVNVGIESGCDNELSIFNKDAKVSDNQRIISILWSHGINMEAGFILFNPYTKIESVRRSLEFLHKNGMCANVNYFTRKNVYVMYKDTALHNKIIRDGLIGEGDFAPANYRFKSDTISELSECMFNFFDEHMETVSMISYFTTSFATLLNHYIRCLLSKGAGTSYVMEEKSELSDILAEFGERVYETLDLLLYSCETSWNIDRGAMMLDEGLGSDYLPSTLKRLNQVKKEIYGNIIKLGYGDILVDSK